MNDGTIGFNPSGARSNLNAFSSGMASAITGYNNACEGLMSALFNAWASPKAVEFSNTYVPRLIEVSKSARSLGETVISRATSAVAAVARANNSYFSFDSSIPVGTCNLPNLQSNKNGVTGMEISDVENAINTFESKMNSFFSALESLPTGISLYDPSGAQRSAYISLMKGKRSEIENLVSDMKSSLKQTIEEERLSIEKAKAQAVDTLSS